jgi:hypothetical protein
MLLALTWNGPPNTSYVPDSAEEKTRQRELDDGHSYFFPAPRYPIAMTAVQESK